MSGVQQLTIERHLLEQIIHHAQTGYPYEVCGLAGGHGNRIEVITPVPNASRDPQHAYEMERQAMVDAIIAFQRAGHEVLAIYHSHPDSEPNPSEQDVNEATWPDAVYLIVGVQGEAVELKAWTIRTGSVSPAQIVPIN